MEPQRLPTTSSTMNFSLHRLCLAASLPLILCSTSLRAFGQDPVHQDPTAEQTDKVGDPIRGFAAWGKMQRLIGGEWHVGMHFPMKAFHRFIEGPGGSSILLETRDKQALENPLASVSVIFHDPSSDQVRGISVDKAGAVHSSHFYWLGETLVNELNIHSETSAFQNGVVQVKETSSDFVGRWHFESNDAYRWELFAKGATGVSSMMETNFTRKTEMTELPEPNVDESKPRKGLRFFNGLLGPHKASEGDWSLTGSWRANSNALWVERNLPNPLGDAPLQVVGFYFWNSADKEFQFIGFSKLGDMVRGTTKQAEGKQIKSSYRIIPVATKDEVVLPEENWGQLSEVMTPLEGGLLKIDWVSVAPKGKPKLLSAELRRQ